MVIQNALFLYALSPSQSNRIMENPELTDVEISGWWAFATIALVIAGGAMIVARTIGPEAVDMLIKCSLITVFMLGGVLVGLLATQAIGASQLWGLGIEETAVQHGQLDFAEERKAVANRESVSEALEDDEEIDPFYEIMKQNRSRKSAA